MNSCVFCNRNFEEQSQPSKPAFYELRFPRRQTVRFADDDTAADELPTVTSGVTYGRKLSFPDIQNSSKLLILLVAEEGFGLHSVFWIELSQTKISRKGKSLSTAQPSNH